MAEVLNLDMLPDWLRDMDKYVQKCSLIIK